MASFVLSFFPLDVLDEIWDLIESVSEGFLTYSHLLLPKKNQIWILCQNSLTRELKIRVGGFVLKKL